MKALRAAPNAAHGAIRDLQNKSPQLTLVTQNVDDLHEGVTTVQMNPGGSDWDTHVSYNFRCAAGVSVIRRSYTRRCDERLDYCTR
jgi:NAD-dependent SIR2 family protein deacetylase